MVDFDPSMNLPWDDDPDPIEEAERFLKENPEEGVRGSQVDWARTVIEYLLGYINDEL